MSTDNELQVVSVERIDGTQIIVEFSDATYASYPVQELVALRPIRKKLNGDPPENGRA